MTDHSDQAKATTASPEDIAAAGDAVPVTERPAVPMRHRAGKGAPIIVETSGNAAAEAGGKLQVDNDAPPAATAGSG